MSGLDLQLAWPKSVCGPTSGRGRDGAAEGSVDHGRSARSLARSTCRRPLVALIIRDVFDGIRRFGALQRNLGLARNILSDGCAPSSRTGSSRRAPRRRHAYHEYALTPKGRDLFVILVALRQWGEDHLFDEAEPHSVLLDVEHDRPLRTIELLDADGRP